LRHHHLHARVRGVGRAEHRNAFVRFVYRILLAHLDRGENVVRIGIHERDVGTDLDALSGGRVG
jgi:hypothetical protein